MTAPAPAPECPSPPVGQRTNGFAIASLITGLFGLAPAGITFGVVALVKIRKRPQRGRGLAIGGLVTSGVWLLLYTTVAVLVVLAVRDGRTLILPSGHVFIEDLAAGDCVDGLTGETMDTLPLAICEMPHEGEVYDVFDLPDGPWPGEKAVDTQIQKRCIDGLTDLTQPGLSYQWFAPVEEGWPGFRRAFCIAYDEDGLITGQVHP
ncbi:MAG: DUF4190 domain-containing protein [Actinoplanes sp.]